MLSYRQLKTVAKRSVDPFLVRLFRGEKGGVIIMLRDLFLVQCHHMSFVDFIVLPPGHGRSVTDF